MADRIETFEKLLTLLIGEVRMMNEGLAEIAKNLGDGVNIY